MASLTLTIPDADIPRIQAALSPTGLTPRQYIIQTLVSLVQTFEQQRNQQQFVTGYTPIGPS